MATLFERLAGTSGEKIGIHAFSGALAEFFRGEYTGAQVVSMFELTPEQTTDAVWLRDKIAGHPNEVKFLRIFKDVLYLAETGVGYTTQAEFVARMNKE